MKTFTLQNRLCLLSIIGLFALALVLVIDAQPSEASLVQTQSSTPYVDTAQDSIVVQIENVFAVSAKHVFDQDYWIANMHSIQRF
ncbi:MAG: hypothetical protein ACI95C_001875 [Pseudohongiellaceae bacterium]|jgi:hypothetical protein